MDLVPIKVKIGLKKNGWADYPDWKKIACYVEKGAKVCMPYSWHYDKTSGHATDTLDSPFGQQWGMLLVTREFADAAKLEFPTLVTEMTETEAKDFWDNKAYAHLPVNKVDSEELTGLQAELELHKEMGSDQATIDAVKVRIAKALDPDDSASGVRKNKEKYYDDAKTVKGFTMEASVTKIQ